MTTLYDAYRPYRITALIWAGVFAVVGAAFVIVPAQVGDDLGKLAELFGFSGVIGTEDGTLWHVLAASLMASITALALQTAKNPDLGGPFVTLIVAKLVSTVGFLLLARQGLAWLLPAWGDFFVALTLWVTRAIGDRRLGRRSLMGRYLVTIGGDGASQRAYTERVQAMPWHLRSLVSLVTRLLQLMGPLVLMGQVSRAQTLSDDDFQAFVKRLNHHPHPWVRGAWLLVHVPAFGVVVDAHQRGAQT